MIAKAYIKNLPISPKKMRFLLAEIKKLGPIEALRVLQFSPKKGARFFWKAIKAALDTQPSLTKMSPDLVKFKVLTIEEGRKLKRWRAGSKGMAKTYWRRSAHIRLVISAEDKSLKLKKIK